MIKYLKFIFIFNKLEITFNNFINIIILKIYIGHDSCPIAPVYIGDAKLANKIAELMFKENIYVIGFSYPVVPKVLLKYYFKN